MTTRLGVAMSLVAGLVVSAGMAVAHHSDAVYDMTRLKVVKGTVTEHQFINPHQIIKMKAKNADGTVTPWILVGAAVSATRASGWTKDTLKTGDEVTAFGFAYRDGKPNMTWMRIITADGKMLPISGAKNDKLSRFLGTYGKDQLSPEDYELFKKSITYVGTGDPNQR
jgi:hypothetical protein